MNIMDVLEDFLKYMIIDYLDSSSRQHISLAIKNDSFVETNVGSINTSRTSQLFHPVIYTYTSKNLHKNHKSEGFEVG